MDFRQKQAIFIALCIVLAGLLLMTGCTVYYKSNPDVDVSVPALQIKKEAKHG